MSGDKPMPGGSLSVELLADLHAGVLDEPTATRLWQQVQHDPQAQATLAALDATSRDLASVGSAPTTAMPDDVANRIDAALADELQGQRNQQHGASVVSIGAARRKRNRRVATGTGIITTAAAAVAAIAVLNPGSQGGGDIPNVAQTPPNATAGDGAPALALRSDHLGSAVGAVLGVRNFGPLRSEERLQACLKASGITPSAEPVGVRPATIDGRHAVIVLYPTGKFAQYRLIALPADCGPNNPGVLKDIIIGRGATDGD